MVLRAAAFIAGLALAAAPGTGVSPQAATAVTISPLSLFFPAADPDTVPRVPATGPLVVDIVCGQAGSWQLTVLANGTMKGAGGPGLPAEAVDWTATTSPPFVAGTVSDRRAQLVASGSGAGSWRGELNFRLLNDWTYRAGDYGNTLTFTLSGV